MAARNKTKASTKKSRNAAKDGRPPTAAEQPKQLSALDAAARVLGEKGQAMNCQEMIEAMAAKGYQGRRRPFPQDGTGQVCPCLALAETKPAEPNSPTRPL